MYSRPYVLLIFLTVFACEGRIYEVCEFAEEVKHLFGKSQKTEFEAHVELITCIAGYMKYNTSREILDSNGHVRYRGIFALRSSEARYCFTDSEFLPPSKESKEFTNNDLMDDFFCLRYRVLMVPETLETYKQICAPHLARKLVCPDSKDGSLIKILVPFHDDIMEKRVKGELELEDILPANL